MAAKKRQKANEQLEAGLKARAWRIHVFPLWRFPRIGVPGVPQIIHFNGIIDIATMMILTSMEVFVSKAVDIFEKQ